MKPLYRRCAGLDIHKKSVSACIRVRDAATKQTKVETAVFGTYTQDLMALRDWLNQHKVQHVAMESTGVYWIPVWNVLERSHRKLELLLVNPQQVKALPGRKTDQQDSDRICELLQYGLLRGSFIPPPPVRELRDLTRSRVNLQQERNRVINRIGRLLETVNIKLSSAVSNIVGKTGMLILQQIASGVTNPEGLAELAQGKLKGKKEELAQALKGYLTDHFRWLLRERLAELAYLDARLEQLEERITIAVAPHQDAIRRLCTIPGVNKVVAWTLLAELGTDMSVFPDAAHAASWAGLCPGNKESAGKRQSGRTKKGDRYLRRILVQSAWAVTHKKNCFLTALFYRVGSRKGIKRAAMAVAHRVLVLAYCILRDGTEYREIGKDYYDRLHPERTAMRLAKRLERIGYGVVLMPRQEQQTTPESEAKPRRGRPCKCADRGVPCPHTGDGLAGAPGNPLRKQAQKRPRTPVEQIGAACPMCANWGIDCIHARNRRPKDNDSGSIV